MSDKTCTLRTRKFITNRLLLRKQFVSPLLAWWLWIRILLRVVSSQVIDVLHPGKPNVSKVRTGPLFHCKSAMDRFL